MTVPIASTIVSIVVFLFTDYKMFCERGRYCLHEVGSNGYCIRCGWFLRGP